MFFLYRGNVTNQVMLELSKTRASGAVKKLIDTTKSPLC